jgi:hypothetical protein
MRAQPFFTAQQGRWSEYSTGQPYRGLLKNCARNLVEMGNVRCASNTRFLFVPNQLAWFGIAYEK